MSSLSKIIKEVNNLIEKKTLENFLGSEWDKEKDISEYSMQLAQDLKVIYGLDVKTELSNILSTNVFRKISKKNMMMIEAFNVYKYIDSEMHLTVFHEKAIKVGLKHSMGSAKKLRRRRHLLCDAVDELKSRGFRRPTRLHHIADIYLQIKGVSP